jgi:hypothetical protein
MTEMGIDLEGNSCGLFEVLPLHLPEMTVKNSETVMTAGVPAKILTNHLPNVNLQRYF